MLNLRLSELSDPGWEAAGIGLPAFPVEEMRRKTLANGLKNSELLHFSKEEIEAAITACGWPLTIRGEALNLQEFARLTDELCK